MRKNRIKREKNSEGFENRGSRGCWYREKEGEMFAWLAWGVGAVAKSPATVTQRWWGRVAMTRGLIGGARGAAFRVSRSVARSHGSAVRIRRPCELHLFEKKKKDWTGSSNFPLHGNRDKESSIRKSAKFLSQILFLRRWYTTTHTHTHAHVHVHVQGHTTHIYVIVFRFHGDLYTWHKLSIEEAPRRKSGVLLAVRSERRYSSIVRISLSACLYAERVETGVLPM